MADVGRNDCDDSFAFAISVALDSQFAHGSRGDVASNGDFHCRCGQPCSLAFQHGCVEVSRTLTAKITGIDAWSDFSNEINSANKLHKNLSLH